MRRGATLGLAVAALVAAFAMLPAPAPAKTARPKAFSSCTSLIGYARHRLKITHGVPARSVEPVFIGAPQAMASPGGTAPAAEKAPSDTAAQDYSTTNIQEEGVDEPDIVKTDGSTIFAVSGSRLFAVGARGDTPALLGSLDLPANASYELLRHGNRLIVISNNYGPVTILEARPAIASYPYASPQTTVTEVDISDPAKMKVARTLTVDGSYVSARQNGSTARVVISSPPRAVNDTSLRARTAGWVPTRRFHSRLTGRKRTRAVASCHSIRHPREFSGLGMVTILTLDLNRGIWAADSDALMADAQIVYGSQDSLYIATQRWINPATPVDRIPHSVTTVIHRFDVTDPGHTTFRGAGQVPGFLLNQFSLSEYKGKLRAATTSQPIWWGEQPQEVSQSRVTVLDLTPEALVPVGSVGGLGKGERIYSVRFVEDAGFVVTFRQVDPLYTVDLATPSHPKVVGELKLEGYSAYLHPIGRDLLLGVGRDATPEGRVKGTQLSLFDVADLHAPKLLAQKVVGTSSSSEVEFDHHAFLYWSPTKLSVIPMVLYPDNPSPESGGSSTPPFTGAIGYRIDRTGIDEVGRITHDSGQQGYMPPVRRSIVIGSRLFTLSDGGVLASALDTLARQAWVPFPAP